VVDSTNSDETQAPAPVPGPPKRKSPIALFLASSTGRLIVGGVLLFTVVVVVGAYLFMSLLNTQPTIAPVTGPSDASTGTSQTALEATRPPDLPLDDTFTFRNVFAPTVKPPTAPKAATTDDSSSSDTSSSTSSIPKDTLVLKSIVTSDGKKVASLYWNGKVYNLHEGDQVDDSPWEVVTIYSDSVLMLYGDSRVTLTVGQGFSK
jgi:hypothetical protein